LKKRVARLTMVLGLLLLVLAPAAVQAQDAIVGTAVISDGSGTNDSVNLSMSGIPQPPDGTRYSLILLSDDGLTSETLGELVFSEDGIVSQTFSSSSDLIANASNLWIVFGPPDLRSYAASIAASGIVHIRHVLIAGAGDDPLKKGYLNGASDQAAVALLHANLALSEANNGNLAGAKLHAEHVVNIIDGTTEDLNGDGQGQNPGDGIGLVTYAAAAGTHTGFAAASVPDSTPITENAVQVQTATANVLAWAADAKTNAGLVQRQTTLSLATLFVEKTASSLGAVINGRDANGNGSVEALTGEAGLTQARWYAQWMATYEISPARLGKLPNVGDSTVPVLPFVATIAGVSLLMLGFGLRRRWTTS